MSVLAVLLFLVIVVVGASIALAMDAVAFAVIGGVVAWVVGFMTALWKLGARR